MRDPAVVMLEDGRTFTGLSHGARGTRVARVVFLTAMTGYQESLTDPAMSGRIVVMTTPHIGNTGVNSEDNTSERIWAAGMIVREPARTVSNWRATGTLESLLVRDDVVSICNIDTRALTRHLREYGGLYGVISTDIFDADELAARIRAGSAE